MTAGSPLGAAGGFAGRYRECLVTPRPEDWNAATGLLRAGYGLSLCPLWIVREYLAADIRAVKLRYMPLICCYY